MLSWTKDWITMITSSLSPILSSSALALRCNLKDHAAATIGGTMQAYSSINMIARRWRMSRLNRDTMGQIRMRIMDSIIRPVR